MPGRSTSWTRKETGWSFSATRPGTSRSRGANGSTSPCPTGKSRRPPAGAFRRTPRRAPSSSGARRSAWSSGGPGKRKGHEEERVAEKQVSLPADRRENKGAGRLAGQDARPAPDPGQGSRSRSHRGVEVERGSGVVARRIDLHGRDLQERREDDFRQRGGSEGSLGSLQLEPRRKHKACH